MGFHAFSVFRGIPRSRYVQDWPRRSPVHGRSSPACRRGSRTLLWRLKSGQPRTFHYTRSLHFKSCVMEQQSNLTIIGPWVIECPSILNQICGSKRSNHYYKVIVLGPNILEHPTFWSRKELHHYSHFVLKPNMGQFYFYI